VEAAPLYQENVVPFLFAGFVVEVVEVGYAG
jgi:hypothetical protein